MKVYKIATGGYKELLITQSVRNLQNAPGGEWERPGNERTCTMPGCFQITQEGNAFLREEPS